jgi:hypothetical protein
MTDEMMTLRGLVEKAPDGSFGMRSSTVPARVSQTRSR